MDTAVTFGLLIVAFAGVAWFFARRYEQKRTREFAAVAEVWGMEFFPKGDSSLKDKDGEYAGTLGDFSLLKEGHGQKLKNLIRGRTQSVDVSVFDYTYTVGGGDSSSTHRQTVVHFECDRLALPKFELRPEHLGHRLAKLFGYQDINFPESPKFSKKYLLRGEDEPAIRDAFTADVLEHLESLDGLHVAGDRSKLIVYRHDKRVRPAELDGFLREAFGIYSQFKAACDASLGTGERSEVTMEEGS